MKKLLLIMLPFVFLCSCSTVHKASHQESSVKDSASSVQVKTLALKQTQNDSAATEESTDSSLIETNYERKVIAEEYFIPEPGKDTIKWSLDEAHLLVRKTTTYEKGSTKEQKAIKDKKNLEHSQLTSEMNAKDTNGATAVHQEHQTGDKQTDKKSFLGPLSIFSLAFLIIILIVCFRYILPAYKGMFVTHEKAKK